MCGYSHRNNFTEEACICNRYQAEIWLDGMKPHRGFFFSFFFGGTEVEMSDDVDRT